MTMNSGLRNRKVVVMIAVAFAVVTLAGCSKITYEEAVASDHRVVQVDYHVLGGREWVYIGPDDVEVPLTVDCSEHLFDGSCHASPDGTVQFHYYTHKGAINNENIILDGVQMEAECKTDDIFGSDYVCAPVPTD